MVRDSGNGLKGKSRDWRQGAQVGVNRGLNSTGRGGKGLKDGGGGKGARSKLREPKLRG